MSPFNTWRDPEFRRLVRAIRELREDLDEVHVVEAYTKRLPVVLDYPWETTKEDGSTSAQNRLHGKADNEAAKRSVRQTLSAPRILFADNAPKDTYPLAWKVAVMAAFEAGARPWFGDDAKTEFTNAVVAYHTFRLEGLDAPTALKKALALACYAGTKEALTAYEKARPQNAHHEPVRIERWRGRGLPVDLDD